MKRGTSKLERKQEIAATVRAICRQSELLIGIPDEDDFFDYGVSSLAVIQMQVRIESLLNIEVPTAILMELPTINSWIDLYSGAIGDSVEVGTPGGSSSGAAR